jgi:hypothetical protein
MLEILVGGQAGKQSEINSTSHQQKDERVSPHK